MPIIILKINYNNGPNDAGPTIVVFAGGGAVGSIPKAFVPSPEVYYLLFYTERFIIFVYKRSNVITQLKSWHLMNND